MRTWIRSAAVLGLATAVTGAGFAQAKLKKAPAKATVKKAPAVTPAPAKTPAQETCEFQVRTRSKVGYRGTATYYVKGPWIREEKRSGGGMELILVNNEKGLFIRNKHTSYWFRYPDGLGMQLRERLLGGPIGDVKRFLKSVYAANIGKEKVEGVLCNIWTYRLKGADDKFRLWTDLSNTKPIRLERDHKVPGTQKRDVLVIEYKRYLANHSLPDSLFQIPQNAKIHEISKSLFRKREVAQKSSAPRATPKPAPAPKQ